MNFCGAHTVSFRLLQKASYRIVFQRTLQMPFS